MTKTKTTTVATQGKATVSTKRYLDTLKALRTLRYNDNLTQSEVDQLLNAAWKEVKDTDEERIMFRRVLLHVGDVSRRHQILHSLNIKSKAGGAQMRANFRKVLNWWMNYMPESFEELIPVFVEFTVLENLMYYQNTTDRKTGKLLSTEIVMAPKDMVFGYLQKQIKNGLNLQRVARHLPAHKTGGTRTAKKMMKAFKGKSEFLWTVPAHATWAKINGKSVTWDENRRITVRDGDVVSYPRQKQGFTKEKQTFINQWIHDFCEYMGWSVADYKEFRKKQSSPEQLFSSGEIVNMDKDDFGKFLDGLTSGQRFLVHRKFVTSSGEPKEKWGKLATWYKEWEAGQNSAAEAVRQAEESGDEQAKKEAMKKLKVKTTGLKTFDLLLELLSAKKSMSADSVNTLHTQMVQSMDLVANVFPIIDGSGSMSSSWGRPKDLQVNGISFFDVAAAMLVTFSTMNPNPEFRNTYGWFSNNFKIVGPSKYVNTAPNTLVTGKEFIKKSPEARSISASKTFSKNLEIIRTANPGEIASTNMAAVIEYFLSFMQRTGTNPESLPQCLLFITDGEFNTGGDPRLAVEKANSLGWYPICIYWLLQEGRVATSSDDNSNVMYINGFSESVLSQVLRNIRTGSIDPTTELWAINDDPRYSMVK